MTDKDASLEHARVRIQQIKDELAAAIAAKEKAEAAITEIAEWASSTDCLTIADHPTKCAQWLVGAMVYNRDLKIKDAIARAERLTGLLVEVMQYAGNLDAIDPTGGPDLRARIDAALAEVK